MQIKTNYPELPEHMVIMPSATIYHGVELSPFTIIHHDVVIDVASSIGSFCELEGGTKVGKNCMLQGRVRTGPNSVIEDGVVIKYGVILTNDSITKENAFIGPNVIYLGGNYDRKRVNGTVVGKNCYIGAGTKVAGGVTICDDAVVGANSFVNKDITKPGIYAGTPAKFIKEL